MDIRNELDNSTVLIQSSGDHSPYHHTAPSISILSPEQRLTKWKAVSVDQMATLIKKNHQTLPAATTLYPPNF